MFELVDATNQAAVIKVIGVGGGGGNALQHMLGANIEGVEFICANTDSQALRNSNAKTVLQLGTNMTKGLGAGADPEVGRQAALEDRDRLMDVLEGSDMIFITAGMGGGTGTGAAPIVAQVAKEMGILTVAVVTRPFSFEGKKRAAIADEGIIELSQFVDSLITIPNEKLLSVLGRDVSLLNAFSAANDVLLGAVQGIAQLITCPGLINVDFADVRTVMSEMGMAMMGSGKAQGEERAKVAAEAAISSPLLEDVNLSGARGILVNITAGMDLSIGEFDEVGRTVKEFASENATVVVGTVIDPEMSGDIRVTIVATGLGNVIKEDATRIKLVQENALGLDYKDFERPTVMRNQSPGAERSEGSAEAVEEAVSADTEYLDIPAFLRRQAD
ncbi:MAG: cell division protein FtsZ [Legionellales bacterium]|nr:cell division protein FtsZ [Legionellales bacterium]|tara:strand:+ start:520 stop:1683 length:1164 start_codon:yes stop_codon:yes gene_type:complete